MKCVHTFGNGRHKRQADITLLFQYTSLHLLLLSSADFLKINFFKNSFTSTIRESNHLSPDQDQLVGPDLDLNCLQRLSTDDKVAINKERVKRH